jgi:hypothetical protein
VSSLRWTFVARQAVSPEIVIAAIVSESPMKFGWAPVIAYAELLV